MPESTLKLCEEADAILLGACGLPSVRYPDNTEIMPQVELRFIFDLYAGVRPARLIPGVPSPIVGAAERGIDFVLIRESTEGLFASMGKGVVTDERGARDAGGHAQTPSACSTSRCGWPQRRKSRGRPGRLTLVDKANVFKAFNWQREIFDERKAKFPDVETDKLYVDACAAMMVRKPWDFDVMVMENMFGDILSDLAAGLIGGLGMAPSADIGDKHAVFQPCHGTAPDIMGQGKANPTAMILSAAMMLDWLADKHDHPPAAEAALAHRARGRRGLCRRPQADGIRRRRRHRGNRRRGAQGAGLAARRAAPGERFRLVRVPDEQERQAEHESGTRLTSDSASASGAGMPIDRANGDEARLLHAERARHQEGAGAHRLAEAFDHDRVAEGNRIAHQPQRHEHFERADKPDDDVHHHGESEARKVGIDAHEIVVQAGEIGERRPAESVGQRHQAAVDQLGAAETLRRKKSGQRQPHDRGAGDRRHDQPRRRRLGWRGWRCRRQ